MNLYLTNSFYKEESGAARIGRAARVLFGYLRFIKEGVIVCHCINCILMSLFPHRGSMRCVSDCVDTLARNAKVQFLKMFFWIPFIAVIAVISPISRSRRPNSRYRGTATTAIYLCACPVAIMPNMAL